MWSTRMGLLALLALTACGSSPTGPSEDLASQPGGSRSGGSGIDTGPSRECGNSAGGATVNGAQSLRKCLK